jgi:hypothetical protein
MKTILTPFAAAIVLTLAGCSSIGPPSYALNAQDGPAFTEEEKSAMTTEEKAEIYNEQQDQEDQVVCRRERPVGSRMMKTVCRTRSEIEQERVETQDAIRPAKGYSQGAGN